ncbi:diguanylate cyclase, partial [Acinetobacter baumannii]
CLVALASGAAADAAQRALARERAEGNHDRLTGALNWRGFYEAADAAFTKAVADDLPLALTLIDVDHFHAIVIADGRDAADRLLVALMKLIGD